MLWVLLSDKKPIAGWSNLKWDAVDSYSLILFLVKGIHPAVDLTCDTASVTLQTFTMAMHMEQK